MQGGLCLADRDHAAVAAGNVVPLPGHCALPAVPAIDECLTNHCGLQGNLWRADGDHATVAADNAVPLPGHRTLPAVPAGQHPASGGEFGDLQRAAAAALGGPAAQGDRADACLHGGPGLCHQALHQVRPLAEHSGAPCSRIASALPVSGWLCQSKLSRIITHWHACMLIDLYTHISCV